VGYIRDIMSVSNPVSVVAHVDSQVVNQSPSSPSNIWRVEKESHIDKIITNNKDKIVMVVFSYGDPRLKIFLKRQLAVKFPNCVFVLALVNTPGAVQEKKYNFLGDRGTYIQELRGKQLPFVFFYYDAKYMVNIAAAQPSVIVETLVKLVAMANNTGAAVVTTVQPSANPPGANIQNQMQQNKLAHEYQIEKMTQQKKIHDLVELQKMQKIKEAEEAIEKEVKLDKSDE